MADDVEQAGFWAQATSEGANQEPLNGMELAEAPTSPAHLEDQPESYEASAAGPVGNEGGATERRATRATAQATANAAGRRRGRGGRPRVTAEQDRRILEVFEKAKGEGRSLKEAAEQLSNELGQPADYINQRYYYLQRRTRPEPPRVAVRQRGRRGRAAPAAAAQPAAPQAAVGRRRGRGRQAARAEQPQAAPAGAGLEQRLAELSDVAGRQLGALTERLERLEQRLAALERRRGERAPAGGDEELYNRLGRVLIRAAFGALE